MKFPLLAYTLVFCWTSLSADFEEFQPAPKAEALTAQQSSAEDKNTEEIYNTVKVDAKGVSNFEPEGFYIGPGRSSNAVTAVLGALQPGRAINIPFSTHAVETGTQAQEVQKMDKRLAAGLPPREIPTRLSLTYPLPPDLKAEVFTVFDRRLPRPETLGQRTIVVHDFATSGSSSCVFAQLLRDYLKERGRENPVKLFWYGVDAEPTPNSALVYGKKQAEQAGIPFGMEVDHLYAFYKKNLIKPLAEYPSYRPGLVDPGSLQSQPAYERFANTIKRLVHADTYWTGGDPNCFAGLAPKR